MMNTVRTTAKIPPVAIIPQVNKVLRDELSSFVGISSVSSISEIFFDTNCEPLV
jgi:hypothetical protein